MTAAQADYLAARGIDPRSLVWGDAIDFGIAGLGHSEAARLPDGRILLAHGHLVHGEPVKEARDGE